MLDELYLGKRNGASNPIEEYFLHKKIPTADYEFLIKLPPKYAQSRIKIRGSKKDPRDSLHSLILADEIWERYFKKYKMIKINNNSKIPNDAVNDILKHIGV